MSFLKKLFGSKNERYLKSIQPLLEATNALEPRIQALSDEDLRGQTPRLKEKLANGATLDDLLPEAFATMREASRRVLHMRHFDVQVLGGVLLHQGRIAEMRTGEGKTLVATLPGYLNALTGKGVHVVTVNDYLATRDAEWMGRAYKFLGMSVGVIVPGINDAQRQAAYRSDVTYGTNNEFGFDYLRDNMKFDIAHYVHRYYPKHVKIADGKEVERLLNFAIVDEVDSVLVDEARTPLIISGPAEESADIYYRVNTIIPFLKRDQDFTVDEKAQSCSLTESGIDKVEKRLLLKNLYDPENIEVVHVVDQALRAHQLYKRDVRYVVEDGKIVIIDEFTGRKMQGRRWSDGLHQCIEAKEGLQIQEENQTLATITFQNYFRLYEKLAGMTGTADTEAEEFEKIYALQVMVTPTHRPMVRKDNDDVVYKTERAKLTAVVDEITDCHKRGQPVLVGTTSVDKSERLSGILTKKGVPHHVLNAKHHAREADIIAQAGQPGAVTVSTNMAGRGTDILLGGNPENLARNKALAEIGNAEGEGFEAALEKWMQFFTPRCEEDKQKVIAAGGLHILGTERHESRRIDNQLRGRAGRQGDPGSSHFFMSLDDDLLRIFGGDRLKTLMDRFKIPDDEPITHRWITKTIENAQKKVEGQNFEIRKNLLEYDDVMNHQRRTIYALRRRVLEGQETHELVLNSIEEVAYATVEQFCSPGVAEEEWDVDALVKHVHAAFGVTAELAGTERKAEDIAARMAEIMVEAYQEKEGRIVDGLASLNTDPELSLEQKEAKALEVWRNYEMDRYLRAIDHLWKQHLYAMDHLRESVQLHAYAQKNPKEIYKHEAFDYFSEMMDRIYANVVGTLFRVEVQSQENIQRRRQQQAPQRVTYGHGTSPAGQAPAKPSTVRRTVAKVGRNDPCPCGSGKKYKNCCLGKLEAG
jgi:preprotein translocase subunit SecA